MRSLSLWNAKDVIVVANEAEYKAWMAKQSAYYETVVKPTLAASSVTTVESSTSTLFEKTLKSGVALVGALSTGIESKLIAFIDDNAKIVDKETFHYYHLIDYFLKQVNQH